MLLLGVAVLIVLLKCGKPVSNPTEKPLIKPAEKIIKETIVDSASTKKAVDSVGSILNKIDNQLSRTTTALFNAQDEILFLQQERDSLLSLKEADDLTGTAWEKSEVIRDRIDSLYKNIAALNQQKIEQKDALLLANEEFKRKIKANLDTCLQNQSFLTAISKKDSSDNKKRNKFGAGPATMVFPKAGVGAGIVFIDKKDRVYNIDGLRIGSEWYVGGSLKFIIHTRKK